MSCRERLALVVVAGVIGACDFTPPDSTSDAPPSAATVAFEIDATNADERSDRVALKLVLSEAVDQPVIVGFSFGGTATPASDFTIDSNMVTIPPNQLTHDIVLKVEDDGVEGELSETIIVTLTSASNAAIGPLATHTVTIADRILPRVQFAAVSTNTPENVSSAIMLTLNAPAQGETTIDVAVQPSSTATPGTDAALAAVTTVTFADGATSAMLPINAMDDLLDEDDTEHFDLVLQNPSANLIIGQTFMATHLLADDDATPSIGFSAIAAQAEGAGTVAVTVTLSAVSGRNVAVNYSVTGGTATIPADATLDPAPGALMIPAGTATTTINVAIDPDALDEPNETIDFALASPTNATLGTATLQLTINDDDNPPNISFEAASSAVTEAEATVELNLVLSAPSGRTIQAPVAIVAASTTANNPADFTLVSTTVTFAPGVTTMPVQVAVKNDTLDEPAEVVVIALGNANDANEVSPTQHTLTINDDNDAPSQVQFDPTQSNGAVLEGDSGQQNFQYRLVLDKASGFQVTVPVIFSGDANIGVGADYTSNPNPTGNPLTASIVFPPGQTTATITLTVFGDNNGNGSGDGGSEDRITMTIDGGAIVNATLVNNGVDERTHDILDDD